MIEFETENTADYNWLGIGHYWISVLDHASFLVEIYSIDATYSRPVSNQTPHRYLEDWYSEKLRYVY